MSDSSGTTDSSGAPPATGFMASITSAFNSGIDKAKSMVGATPTPAPPAPGPPAPGDKPGDKQGDPPPPPPTEPSLEDKYLSFIPADVRYYLTYAIKIIIPLLFAMIVANEMIIYKPSVRLFYFIVTWALCFLYVSFRWIIVIYYILRLIFNSYKKNEGAGGGFFPTIYALLPWTTDVKMIRPFQYLFQYLNIDIGDQSMAKAFEDKSFQKKLKSAYYLGEKMVGYFKVLESADPYRGYEIYAKNFENVKKSLFEMHMPALKIDHENKKYIVRLHRDKKEGEDQPDEFIEITEGSIEPNINKPSDPTPETLHKVTYDKAENKFTLAVNATAEKDTTKMNAEAAEAARIAAINDIEIAQRVGMRRG
jgi:hypothetical protein